MKNFDYKKLSRIELKFKNLSEKIRKLTEKEKIFNKNNYKKEYRNIEIQTCNYSFPTQNKEKVNEENLSDFFDVSGNNSDNSNSSEDELFYGNITNFSDKKEINKFDTPDFKTKRVFD